MSRVPAGPRPFQLRIQAQAVLLSVVPLAFLITLSILASVLQNRTEQTATLSQRSTNALNQSDLISKAISGANRSVIEYTTKQPQPRALAPYRSALRDVRNEGDELQRMVRNEPGQELRATRYAARSRDLMGVLSAYLSLWKAGKKTQAQAMVTSPRTRNRVNDWDAAKTAFEKAERELTLERFATLHRDYAVLGTILLASSLAGVVLTVFITGRFGFRIARRLRQLTENARRLDDGEPARAIEGGDEIADLDAAYREMTRRLRETLHQREEALSAYERAHHVASTLQRALLPQRLPDVRGLAFDGVYVPGKSEAQVGGDWYDALRLGDGRILISIGDVVGSGLPAAVIMAAMREVMRGVAQVYADPATIIDAADRTLKTEHPDRLVTAVVGVFDPVAGTLAYCSAGHPPPFMRLADGTVVELPSQGLPLGLRSRDDADARTVEIAPGSTLLFYTDGLTESTKDVIEGERRVRRALTDPGIAARPDLAQALYDVVLREGAHDDVAILVMRLERAPAAGDGTVEQRLHRWSFETDDVRRAQSARAAFASLLREGRMFADDAFTAELIFGELLSNAVRYAPGTVEVVLDWSGAAAVLHFLDRGPGFVLLPRLPSDLLSERGRGLFLVWSLSEDFNVTKRVDGGAHARVVLSPRRRPAPNDQRSTKMSSASGVAGSTA